MVNGEDRPKSEDRVEGEVGGEVGAEADYEPFEDSDYVIGNEVSSMVKMIICLIMTLR